METSKLKKFAQFARRSLIEQVSGKLQQVLAEDSAARREEPKAVEELVAQIKAHGRDQVIEKVADTWFNRFCALRFMDVNRYTRIGVVSPAEGQFQPEILAEAKMGHIDEDMVPEKTRQQIFALLNGAAPSRDPQAEAYRLLVVAACNDYHKAMDYLFEKIADYTELLMPDDLLSGNSILAYTREAMTPEVCGVFSNQPSVISSQKENTDNCPLMADASAAGGVEVIGWLYQFYISEKKNEVFEGLKKNRKITPENIPAATQLFTPHWIVRYLVENSLGRLWMLNRPNSRLAEKMAYYIKPETPETDFLKISKPEEIKVCDPACGSAHMLVYSFDILYFIYEEEGYEATEIPRLILENNLFGIEIDKRAGELAAFALTMKARAKQRRFFSKKVAPNICVLENIHFEEAELKEYMDFIGWDLFTAPLQTTLRQFEEADNFGSLIRPKVTDVNSMLMILKTKNVSGQLFLSKTHKKVLQALRQADYLSPKYHVAVTNPPYMGGKGMNGRLGVWLKDSYGDVKSDLFSAFMVRVTETAMSGGFVGMMTPFNWMFLSSFEKLRTILFENFTLTNLVRPEFHAFFDSAFVTICGFTLFLKSSPSYKGTFIDLHKFYGVDVQPAKALEAIKNPNCGWFYRASAADFKKIPGSPIAYWVSDAFRNLYDDQKVESITISDGQNKTGNNDKFIRQHWEVNRSNVGIAMKWFFYAKGGGFRRWYGNLEDVINWSQEAREYYRKDHICRIIPEYLWYKKGITWGFITSSKPSFRYLPEDATFDVGGSSVFFQDENNIPFVMSLLNTNVALQILKVSNPTINFQVKNIRDVPLFTKVNRNSIENNYNRLYSFSKIDWNSYETSWDFIELPLLNRKLSVGSEKQVQDNLSSPYYPLCTRIADEFATHRTKWQEMTLEMKRLEEENNQILIDAYGLQDELTPIVPLNEISLT